MTKLRDITSDAMVQDAIRRALDEDVGTGDATTLAMVDGDVAIRAAILARAPCRVSGTGVAAAVFAALSPLLRAETRIAEGDAANAGDTILMLSGPARPILTGERTALNFMQRMCGIATLTARFVDRVRPYGTIILDTRKTTPGLRALEKYAVLCGGGSNHRMGLYDRVMLKDNHRRLCRGEGSAGLADAVRRVREKYPELEIEVEVENEEDLVGALEAAPEWILLDNMQPDTMRDFVERCRGRALTEASGGITLENVEAVAASGVDAISLGCLTHSAPAVDLSLEIL